MPIYAVEMTRHMISYRKAVAHDIVAETHDEAAKIAASMSLDWLEDDAIDEGPVDYEVSSPTDHTTCWRDDSGAPIFAPARINIPTFKAGDKVRFMLPGSGDVGDEFVEVPAGSVWTVERVSRNPAPQFATFTIVHESGVVNVIDQTDLVGSDYPLQPL